jgi:hypothetical protein
MIIISDSERQQNSNTCESDFAQMNDEKTHCEFKEKKLLFLEQSVVSMLNVSLI